MARIGTRSTTDAPIDAPIPSAHAIFEYTFSRRQIAEPIGSVRSAADVAGILRDYLQPDTVESERLAVAMLDVKHVIIGVETLYQGNLSGCSVRVAELFRGAVRLNASAVVVAHNHPSGDPTPSADDLALTRDLVAAGRILDIQLVDHVVLGGNGRTASLRAMGYIG